ncbi:MAG: tRNA(His) guanylyltransferase Thg1 family protein [Myxococcota bacterium]
MPRTDPLGDRCKRFESAEAGRRAMPGIPLLCRLDGRAFHTFTRGLARPWDERFATCMTETARALVRELEPRVAYTQSDEITLLWWVSSEGPQSFPFDGRLQKLTSVAAGLASAAFARAVSTELPEKAHLLPCFDARVWQVPTREDALDVFRWREDDASENSLHMAARARHPQSVLHGKGLAELHDLLHADGVNWNDYPTRFKRGVYLRRQRRIRELTDAERARIPEGRRPPEGALVERTELAVLELPPIRKVANAVEVLFDGADPT